MLALCVNQTCYTDTINNFKLKINLQNTTIKFVIVKKAHMSEGWGYWVGVELAVTQYAKKAC